ncbi:MULTISPECIES: potassium channel family protein [unclassified Streptomyces]|uniref:potassium channel family protein n=1 Tax=unclassified Streptomyces TaxID=2593676 RepID=UPI00224D1DDD|nr:MULTISPECIES: potassium channel family protein [unclassified Streptomyces]MCX4525699.1 potassium channel family protein [Streptomyces sp. NBC_01551]MCX4543731.1 potassium channel family protein [Streptomyces sp. NBC_01565]
MKEPSRQARWERRTQAPLLVLAVAFALAYAVPIVAPDASPQVHRACTHAEWVVWGAFAVDYLVRLGLSADRKLFVRTHWLDLAAVVLPLVQPLRLLRLVATLMLVGRRARMAPQIRLTTYVAGAVVGLLMFGSLAVLSVERDAPDGNIKNLGDAVWWSFTTMTTVGYGDHSPTTGLGRVLAVGLMLSGIALLGVVTANIAAWFIARFERDDRVELAQTAAITALAEEVRALRAEVALLRGPAGAPAREDHTGGPEEQDRERAPDRERDRDPDRDQSAVVTASAPTP